MQYIVHTTSTPHHTTCWLLWKINGCPEENASFKFLLLADLVSPHLGAYCNTVALDWVKKLNVATDLCSRNCTATQWSKEPMSELTSSIQCVCIGVKRRRRESSVLQCSWIVNAAEGPELHIIISRATSPDFQCFLNILSTVVTMKVSWLKTLSTLLLLLVMLSVIPLTIIRLSRNNNEEHPGRQLLPPRPFQENTM